MSLDVPVTAMNIYFCDAKNGETELETSLTISQT